MLRVTDGLKSGFFNLPPLETGWGPIAVKVAKVTCGILAFAAVAAGTGTLMKLGGAKLISIGEGSSAVGKAMNVVGNTLVLAGRYAFLSVAVPVYTAVWVIPKWVVTEGIPRLVTQLHRYVLVPAYNGIVRAAHAVYDYVLAPFKEWIGRVATWAWKYIVIPIYREIVDCMNWLEVRVIHFAHFINDRILVPFIDGWRWFGRAVLLPVLKKVAQFVQAIYNHILEPLGRMLFNTTRWIWKAVIIKLVQTVYNRILEPFGRMLFNATCWIWKAVVVPVAGEVLRVSIFVKDVLVHLASGVYRNLLRPMGHLVASSSKWIWNAAVVPIANGVIQAGGFLGSQLAQVVQAVYNLVLAPTGRLIAATYDLTCQALVSIADSTYQTYRWVFRLE